MAQAGDAPPVLPGDVVGGRYRVLSELGRGGMGLVVAAEHLQLPQQVAIKFLLDALDPRLRQRFAREAATVVQLRSEHVCRVLDVGTLPAGEPYMVMERLEGYDLDHVMRQRGRLPVPEVVDWALQICEALAEAHGKGVVHRDLKPSNLFLARGVDGGAIVKVMDFGIAKADEAGAPGPLTQSGVTMGSPRFMAPEQLVSARDVDARADIWALGATLYELLAGEPAFQGHTAAELHVAILQQEPRRLAELRPDVPVSVESAITRALRKLPEERWAHVGEFAAALEPAAPSQARRYVERVQRMVASSPSGPLASAPTALQDATAPQTPAVVVGSASLDHSAPTATPQAAIPTALPRGSTTEGQVVQHQQTTLPSAGSSERRSGLYLGLSAGLLVAALAVFGVVFVMRDAADEAADEATDKLVEQTCLYEKCNPAVKLIPGKIFDPETLIPAAREIARSLEPEAELTGISFAGLQDGKFLERKQDAATFMFAYPARGGERAPLLVIVNGFQMMAQHTSVGQALPAVELPRCTFRDAFAAANANGLFAGETISGSYNGALDQPLWTISTLDSRKNLYVKADCSTATVADVAKSASP